MKVTATEGEPTVFFVESRTVQCDKCARKFANNPKAIKGQTCPHCTRGTLKSIFPHKVDIANFFPVGECQCRGFQINPQEHNNLPKRKELERMTQAQRLLLSDEEQERLRCPHIKAARNFALNRELWAHEKKRLTNGK